MKFLKKCAKNVNDALETGGLVEEEMRKCEYLNCPIWMHGYCTADEVIVQLVCGHKYDDRERTGTI